MEKGPPLLYTGQTNGKMLSATVGRYKFSLMNSWNWLGDFQAECCNCDLLFIAVYNKMQEDRDLLKKELFSASKA